MAKKNEQQLNYGAEVKKLKAEGPKNLYLLWGVEDYLREQYLIELKKLCLRKERTASASSALMDPSSTYMNSLRLWMPFPL